MERWQAKLVVIFGVFAIPLAATLLPLKLAPCFLRQGKKGEKVLSCFMCFGGGVFLSTYMLHMAPEVRELLSHALMEPNGIHYPVADLIMAAGFFLVMFMEKIIVVIKKARDKKEKKNKDKVVFNCDSCACETAAYANPATKKDEDQDEKVAAKVNGTSVNVGEDSEDPPAGECNTVRGGHCYESELLKDSHGGARAIILLVAISFHRLFEGMSIGLLTSTPAVWQLFGAIITHAIIISFSIGLEFVRYNWPVKRMVIACVLCSLFMPAGTAIGTAISEVGDSEAAHFDVLTGVLQAIATGSFIYVTFFEILADEIHSDSLAQPISVLLGFAVMGGLFTMHVHDHHGHGGDHHDDHHDLHGHMFNTTDIIQ